MDNASRGELSQNDQLDRLIAEFLAAVEVGQSPDRQELLRRHADLAEDLEAFFADHDRMKELAGPDDFVAPGQMPVSDADAPTLAHLATTPGNAATLPPTDAQVISADTAPAPGTKVRYFGDYELLEEIARGGMGVVYKARQTSLNRIVALKMILAGQLAGEEDIKRFHAEAEAAANLDHPGIVPIFEVGEHEGQHYFSMGYVEGQSLAGRVSDGPLPPREAAQFTEKIAEAVEFAHDQGVIHRDLKPANVLLDQNDEPRVTDFGLAKRVEGDSDLTATGQILGTPGFMPPEQASGQVDEIDAKADIYSLGAILYNLLTARPPFQADNPLDTLMQVLEQEPVSPRQLNPSVPRDLETICLKCLEKDARRRYASAQDLVDELQRFLNGRPIQARPISAPAHAWRWCKRNPRIATLSAALVVVLLAATAISASFAISENAAKQTAVEARNDEAEQRRVAEERQAEALWNTYVARMQTLRPVWERGDFGQLEVLLDQYEPKEGEPDFRGWEWRYLRDQCREKIRILSRGTVRHAAWRPDGKRLATRREKDGAVLIWDTDASTIVQTLPGEGNAPIAWSPDGRWLAAGRGGSGLDIWDAEKGIKLRAIDCAVSRDQSRWYALGLDWSHDGQRVAYAGDGLVEIFLRDGTPERQFRVGTDREENWIEALDWHPSDMRLGVGDFDGYLYVFDGLSGNQLSRISVSNVGCGSVAWRPDGKQIACSTGYPSASTKVFDEEGNLVATLPRAPGAISWSPDGERIAAAGPPQIVHIWHVESGGQKEMHVHKGSIPAVAWRPDSEQILSAGKDGTLKLWDASTIRKPELSIHARPIAPHQTQSPRLSVDWSPDGSKVISGGANGRVAIWNASNGELVTELAQKGSAVDVVAWHPTGLMVAAISEDGKIRIWDVESREILKTLTAGSRAFEFQYLDWTRDGKRLLCSIAEAPLKERKPVYYWEDGGLGERREMTTAPMCNTSWHPDGDRIAIQKEGQLEIWSVPEHQILLTIDKVPNRHLVYTTPHIWEPEGRLLALGEDGLRFLNPNTGEHVATATLHAGWAFGDWSPAGDRIVTAGKGDAVLKIVDAATGNEVFTLMTGGAAFTDVAFSPDGRRIATADRGGFVRIWGSPNIEPPGDFDYLATGVLAKVQTPEEELKEIAASIRRRVVDNPWSRRDEQKLAIEVLCAVGAELCVDGKWITFDDKEPVDYNTAEGLRVTSFHYVTPFLLRQIAELKNIERLEIDVRSLKSSDLAELARIKSLRELVLVNLHVDAAAVEELAAIPSLLRLELQDASTSDGDAVVSLAKIAVLDTISFRGLSVTDAEVAPLTALGQLKELRLLGTQVTPETVDSLRQTLPDTNVVYDDHRRHREAAEWVLSIGGEVYIAGDTPRRVSKLSDFPNEPFRVATIDLNNKSELGDDDLVHLNNLMTLDKLNLDGTGVSDKGLEHLQNLLELTSLYLNGTRVTGSGLAHLARLDSLTHLFAGGAPVTNDGLSHLPPLPSLRSLMLQSGDLSEGYLAHVSHLPSLTSLMVSSDAATPGLEHLRGTPLETLSLHWQTNLPDESLAHLAAIPNLRELSLRGTRCLTTDGFRHLAQVKTLQKLILTKTNFDDDAVEAIGSLDRLTHLDVTDTKLTPAGLAYLKAAMPRCEVISNLK